VTEGEPQKFYETVVDRVNGIFVKNPFIFTLAVSVVVSLAVLVVSLDYRKGEAAIEISKDNSVADVAGAITKEIKVDLSGAVKKPGVYTLSSASRLADLLALGGGFVSDVSSLWVSKNLNLSQNLLDGEKVYIPFEWDIDGSSSGDNGLKPLSLGIVKKDAHTGLATGELGGSGGTSSTSSSESSSSGLSAAQSVINVNTASLADLDLLPGVGPAYAGRIVENRPYVSLEDFKEKSGLASNLVANLAELVSF
jgi:competence protein ComEA